VLVEYYLHLSVAEEAWVCMGRQGRQEAIKFTFGSSSPKKYRQVLIACHANGPVASLGMERKHNQQCISFLLAFKKQA